jgi:2-keto-4-pentenoate hydratase/2-oxohepta-3-ene-1,7-dioic acid hydratase in catechol pathway
VAAVKYLSFDINGRETYGAITDEGVVDLGKRFGDEFATLRELVAAGFPSLVVAAARGAADFAVGDIRFLPPIADPVHIWCLALNYVEHHNEVRDAGRVQDLPRVPAVFARARDSLTGHEQPLRHPSVSDQFDFEGELAVVMVGDTCEIRIDHIGVLRNRVESD